MVATCVPTPLKIRHRFRRRGGDRRGLDGRRMHRRAVGQNTRPMQTRLCKAALTRVPATPPVDFAIRPITPVVLPRARAFDRAGSARAQKQDGGGAEISHRATDDDLPTWQALRTKGGNYRGAATSSHCQTSIVGPVAQPTRRASSARIMLASNEPI